MTHTVYAATFTSTEIEIPDACPSCGADFHEAGALIEGNWQDCTVRMHLDDGRLEAEGHTDYGETYMPSGLLCVRCDWHLGPAR